MNSHGHIVADLDTVHFSVAEEKLKRSEALLSETQKLTHSGSWDSDLHTGENCWSDEAFRIFGLTPEFKGPKILKFSRMIHPEDWNCYKTELRKIMKGNISNFDLRIVLANGKIKYINAIGIPQKDNNGTISRLYGAIVDITNRKMQEEELIKAKEIAEKAVMVKSRFLSTMSHEIRTPLNAVIGFTNLLLQKDPSPEQQEYLQTLKFSSNNLLTLVNRLLDFDKTIEDNTSIPSSMRAVNSLSGITILIAEDNEINTLLIKQFMKLWGVSCDFAENGIQAFKKVQEKHYDLVLMDLHMPKMDGFEASHAIRNLEDERYKSIPIIALTAYVTDDIQEKTMLSGINDYISKPFNPNDLYEKVRDYGLKYTYVG